MKKIFVLLFICTDIFNVFGQENKHNTLLESIYHKDQLAREKLIEFEQKEIIDSIAFYYTLMDTNDKENRKIVFKILDNEGWPQGLSEKANDAIFLVIQHAPHKFQLKYSEVVKKSAENGKIKQKDFATLYDRILMQDGKKQIYGTQMVAKMRDGNRVSYIWPVENSENIDKLRLSIELLPFDLYIKVVKKSTGIIVVWDKNLTIEKLQSLPDPIIVK
ncbi:MAG: hypothetical protein RR330_02200 [Alistipes sp.]